MNSVFIGGSRRLGQMNEEVAHRLENVVRKQLRVLIGDANGFDRAAQTYLADRGYRSVLVYCTAGECRNNVGSWPTRAVEYHGRDRGLQFYTAKDDAMLRDADFGLFAWDRKSKGTLRNIQKMAELEKPSLVYVSSDKTFVTIRNTREVLNLTRDQRLHPVASDDLFVSASPSQTPTATGFNS